MTDLRRFSRRLWWALVPLLLMCNAVMAQSTHFRISKSPDFSSGDRHFTPTDTIYIRVDRQDIDFTNLEEMRFRLRPRFGDGGIEGIFTSGMDGSYTGVIALAGLDTSMAEWELRMEIKDDAGHEFHARVPLIIGESGARQNGDSVFAFEGFITEVDSGKIRVRDHWIEIDAETRVIDLRMRALTARELRIGMAVKLLVRRLADGTLLAKLIGIDMKRGMNGEFEVRGVISHLDSVSLTLEGLTFVVDSQTEIRDREQDLTLDSLRVGLLVEVDGQMGQDSLLHADKVFVVDREQHEEEFKLSGPIEALDDTMLTVGGFVFGLDQSTRYRGPEHLEFQRDMLQPGVLVDVKGEYRADGRLWATGVRIAEIPGVEVEEEGPIEALGAGTLTVNGVQFTLRDGATISLPHDGEARFDQLSVGMVVKVKAFEDTNGMTWALHIQIRGDRRERIRLKGKIQALTQNSLTVHNTTFEVDSTAEIIDGDGNQITLDALQAGMPVKVKGERTSAGILFAYYVRVRERGGVEVLMTGRIDSLGDNALRVAGVLFQITNRTIVRGKHEEDLAPGDLAVGQLVQVNGRRSPAGRNFALRIRVRDAAETDVLARGNISALQGADVVIENLTFVADDSTNYFDRDGNPIALSGFAVGDFVRVKAAHDSSDNLILLAMQLLEAAELQGQVDSDSAGSGGSGSAGSGNAGLAKISGSQFVLLNTTIDIDANTLVVDAANQPLDPTAIATGAVVDVRGTTVGAGEVLASTITVLEGANPSGVSEQSADLTPESFVLRQNYPNPFNPSTTIRYQIQTSGAQTVVLRVYNTLGQEVVTLMDGKQEAGSYAAVWNGQDRAGRAVASGVYFVRLKVGSQAVVRRMVLNK